MSNSNMLSVAESMAFFERNLGTSWVQDIDNGFRGPSALDGSQDIAITCLPVYKDGEQVCKYVVSHLAKNGTMKSQRVLDDIRECLGAVLVPGQR